MLATYLTLGEIVKPQGTQGEVKIKPCTGDPEQFLRHKTLHLRRGETDTLLAVESARLREGFAYLRLAGCASREDAEALRGCAVCIPRDQAAPPPQDGNFICDLLGCQAFDRQGTLLGTLVDVLQNSPVDVYVFRTPAGGQMLLPALKAAVPEVDAAAGRMVINEEKLPEVAVFAD